MISVVDALYTLKYNPFKYSEHVASFYYSSNGVENNLLLAPLIIPLCSHPFYQKKLHNLKFGTDVRSSIWTVFDNKKNLYDLQERVDAFKELTEQSIQYCLINDWLLLDRENFSFVFTSQNRKAFDRQLSAVKLGKLFNGESIVDIYRTLGVKP